MSDVWVRENHGKMQIFDVRKKAEYAEARIPGAVHVFYKEKSEMKVDFDASKDRFDLSKFPSDKNSHIIVHCNGPR